MANETNQNPQDESVKAADTAQTVDEAICPDEPGPDANPQVTNLCAALAEAKKSEADIKDHFMRLQADFENFKKRSAREKQDTAQYTLESFLKKLLPVIDNLERAQENAKTENLEAYKQGVDMVFKQLMDVLKDEGLSEVEAEGKSFDPNFHHGVAVDSESDAEDQAITGVFQKGYQFKDKVLRPAMVKVCQK